MTVWIEEEEGGGPEGSIASCGLPVLAKVELQGNEPLQEGPTNLFMRERFGIQPSAFGSRIFREIEEDGLSVGSAPLQGLIQILHPFKTHLYLFCLLLMPRRTDGVAPAVLQAYAHQTSSKAHSPGAMLSLAQRQTQAAATRQNPPTT